MNLNGLAVRVAGGLIAAALQLNSAYAQDFDCLWDSLTTVDKARLELASKLGESPVKQLLQRSGETGFSAHLQHCGFAVEQKALNRVAQFLDARAGAEATQALLVANGMDPDAMRRALDSGAAPDQRRALAERIMAFNASDAQKDPAAETVRAAAAAVAQLLGGSEERRARLTPVAGDWVVRRILMDGLKAGAVPPG